MTEPKDRNQCEPDALVVIAVMVEFRRVMITVNLMCLEARSAMELLLVTLLTPTMTNPTPSVQLLRTEER